MVGVRRTIAYLGRLNGGAYDGILGVLLSTRGGCDGSVSDLRWPPMIRSRTHENLPGHYRFSPQMPLFAPFSRRPK